MANYSLIVGSKFSPFTYQELLQPALLATQAHQELENQYADLATKANVWEGLANEQTDPYAYNMYKKYSDDLKSQADILATQGLTLSSRKALAQMKSRYSSEITPIEQAFNARKAANEYRNTIRSKDATAIFRTPKYMSLDYFLKGNDADNTYISGKDVMSRIAAKAEVVGQALYKQLISDGKSPIEALNELIKGENSIIQKLYTDEAEALDMSTLDDNSKKQLSAYLNTGINSALSKVIDTEFMNAAQRDASERAWAQDKRAKKQYELNMAKFNLDMAESGYKYDENKKQYVPDETSPVWTKDEKGNLIKSKSTGTKSNTQGSRIPMLSNAVIIDKKGSSSDITDNTLLPKGYNIIVDDKGNMSYTNKENKDVPLSEEDKKKIKSVVKNEDYYKYYIFRKTKNGELIIIPNKIALIGASQSEVDYSDI